MTEKPFTDAQRWLFSYEKHLRNVRGLASNSMRVYVRVAAKLIDEIEKDGTVDWQKFGADQLAQFVISAVANCEGRGGSAITTCVRSFLRFMVSEGVLRPGLELAIPRMRTYSQRGIPKHLSKNEILQLLKSVTNGTNMGRRNFAILLMLSKFGLRGAEVAGLELKDIDWSNAVILIRTSKTRRERKLPLIRSVAEALLNYLRNGRPATGSCRIFLQHAKPYRPVSATAISKLVGRQILKAGIRTTMHGSHLLRHSVATRLVNSGASFKDIADLLGHQTIESTAIYAKVDLSSLSKIGLPWPGGK